MSLPEWVQYIKDNSRDCSEADELLQALEIAWEAMDDAITHGHSVNEFRAHLRDAMGQIEKLGK